MAAFSSFDTVVIGAGAIGSAVGMGLGQLSPGSVAVVDFDLEGTWSSSELNAGGVRATWNQAVNVVASKLSIEYFATIAQEVGYRDCGYLWLSTEADLLAKANSLKRWRELGWAVEELDIAETRRRYPFLDRTDDLAGAILGVKDGLINPNLLKLHFRAKAKARGVEFVDRLKLVSAEHLGAVEGWKLLFESYGKGLDPEERKSVLLGRKSSAERVEIRAKNIVNCAGAWAGEISQVFGIECPSYAVKRQISMFDCRTVDLNPYGMIIDTSGVYFHSEATSILSGIAVRDEPHGKSFDYDGESFFQERIWWPLSERSSHFESIRHQTGWAGLYEVSPDESAIIGAVEGRPGLFEAHSFSGHGIMQSYAVGLALAERIVFGRYQSLDLGMLSGARFRDGNLVSETAII